MKNIAPILFISLYTLTLFGEKPFPNNSEEINDLHIVLKGTTQSQLVEYQGNLFVKKKSAHREHCQNEFETLIAYEVLGVRVPKGVLYIKSNDELFFLKEYINGVPLKNFIETHSTLETDRVFKILQQDFIVDCLLGNTDTIGSEFNNIIVDFNGIPWRIDFGGGLCYKANGVLKGNLWGKNVHELTIMRDSFKGGTNYKVFGTVSDEEIKRQFKSILTRREALLKPAIVT